MEYSSIMDAFMHYYNFEGAPLLVGCFVVLLESVRCSRLTVIDFLLNFHIKATTSFMAAGGILLFMKCVAKTSFLRISGDHFPPYLVHRICTANSSNFSLPTAWFEEIDDLFVPYFKRFKVYCLWVFSLAFLLALPRVLFSRREVWNNIRSLFTLAEQRPNDNGERMKAIVQLMLKEVRHLQLDTIYFESVVFYFIVAFVGFKSKPTNPTHYQDFAVRSNGSEWMVDCDRHATSQDVYSLIKYLDNDSKFESLYIAPTDNIYLYLRFGIAWCFSVLVLSCVSCLIIRSLLMIKFGRRRLNDIMLLWLLKKNVDYEPHKVIINDFKKKLATLRGMEEERERERRLARDLEHDVAANNGDEQDVQIDIDNVEPA